MGKIALIFPGQGSQEVGMAKEFYENFASSKKIIDQANTELGFDLKNLMFNGPMEELTKTENTQPALLTASIAILQALKEKGIVFGAVAGHSLGEYSAYVAAEKLSFEDAVKAVRKRGELMANADPDKKGGMAAVMRIEDNKVEDICKKYSKVVPANYNCPGQLVISGDKEELAKVSEEIAQAGGRAMPLNVSGPFHSPLMKGAAEQFAGFLSSLSFKDSGISLYCNVNANPVASGKEAELLKEQIYSSVRWTQTIQNMIADGFDTFIEVGSGKVLQGLVKKISKEIKILGVAKLEDFNKLEIK